MVEPAAFCNTPYGTSNYTLPINITNDVCKPRCDKVGKVHHFHREPIECLDTKTVNQEDLPKIDKCCRCGFEQEIQTFLQHASPNVKRVQPIPREEKIEADNVMKVYNERRQKRLQKEALKFATRK